MRLEARSASAPSYARATLLPSVVLLCIYASDRGSRIWTAILEAIKLLVAAIERNVNVATQVVSFGAKRGEAESYLSFLW